MFKVEDVKYNFLSNMLSVELYSLRKKVFKDRLGWRVECNSGFECDSYDNIHAAYLFGMQDNIVVCSTRFIEMNYPNMITGVFKSYFNKIEIPSGNFVEASRLFIDKARVENLNLQHFPTSSLLFLSMINYARHKGYDGIFAIVSHAMYIIFRRSGWLISVVEKGISEKNKDIYLIYMPVDKYNQKILMGKISKQLCLSDTVLDTWPVMLNINF